MALEKAFLEIEGGKRVPCLFNPTTLSISRSNSWDASPMPGKGVPTLEFSGSQSGSMDLSLTFDTTDTGKTVTTYTTQILDLLELDPNLPGSDEQSNNTRPPTVTFHWGDLHSFKAVVTSVNLTFTYFSATGVPLRADTQISLMQFEPAAAYGPQNPTSGTPKPHRVHRVQPGETLDRISARYYGDSTKWRVLANANGLEDPLAVRPGAVLSIPRAEDA